MYSDQDIDNLLAHLHAATGQIKDQDINNSILEAMDLIDNLRIEGYFE